ncbi:MAG TPA: hypothetical protein VGH56_11975 [Solirubrobacteraceae bacterium]
MEGGGAGATVADPSVRRQLARVARLTGPDRYLAYGKLDQQLSTGAAPFVVYGSDLSFDLF